MANTNRAITALLQLLIADDTDIPVKDTKFNPLLLSTAALIVTSAWKDAKTVATTAA
jgi:hypothetical protein